MQHDFLSDLREIWGSVGEFVVEECGDPEGLDGGGDRGGDGGDSASQGDGAGLDLGGWDHKAVEAVRVRGFGCVAECGLLLETGKPVEDFGVGLLGESELFVLRLRESDACGAEIVEFDGWFFLPARGADEDVGGEGAAGGKMDGFI